MKLTESWNILREHLNNQENIYLLNEWEVHKTYTHKKNNQTKINKQIKRKLLTPGINCAGKKKLVSYMPHA